MNFSYYDNYVVLKRLCEVASPPSGAFPGVLCLPDMDGTGEMKYPWQ